MHDKLNILFQQSECPDENILKAYFNNVLSKPEIRKVELHLADCEMCSDYLEGLHLLSGTKILDEEAAIVLKEINKDRSKKNRLFFYAAAASVFIGISVFTLIWFLPLQNNYVSQDVNNDLKKSEDTPVLSDSLDSGINGLYKNPSEVISGDNLSGLKSEEQQVTIVATGKAEDLKNTDIVEKDINSEEGYFANNIMVPGINDQSSVSEIKPETTLSTKLDEEKNKVAVTTEVNQNMTGGAFVSRVSEEEEKVERGRKSDKKNNRENLNQKDTRSVADEVAASEQAPVLYPRNEAPAKETPVDYLENSESNSDLDKAKVFFRQQMIDSAVVYSLRATISCDSCKWSALLLLSKSYITSGQTEKAVTTLKDIKSKAPSRFAKEAKLQLEKLGY